MATCRRLFASSGSLETASLGSRSQHSASRSKFTTRTRWAASVRRPPHARSPWATNSREAERTRSRRERHRSVCPARLLQREAQVKSNSQPTTLRSLRFQRRLLQIQVRRPIRGQILGWGLAQILDQIRESIPDKDNGLVQGLPCLNHSRVNLTKSLNRSSSPSDSCRGRVTDNLYEKFGMVRFCLPVEG
jgi:hypothetical protein